MTSTENASLTNKAMLVHLSISQWTGRKYDKAVSAKVAQDYNTEESAGRYNKVLIAEKAIKEISKIVTEVREFHYANTLPWSDWGDRVLPSANYLVYMQAMQSYKEKFNASVQKFILNYPSLVEEARIRLNGMFRADDYPSAGQIGDRYNFDMYITPLPDAGDFRVSLQSAEVDRIQQDIESRVKDRSQTALNDLWTRLHTAVGHMVDRLSDDEKIFRDSMVTNIVELADLLPRLNVFEDPNLDKIIKEVQSRLCSYQPQQLRDDQTVRKQAAKDAKSILDAMAGYCG